MTNTIHNVPRELLERVLYLMDNYIGTTHTEEDELRALLSAPSPAGVGGLETIGYATESELAQLLDPTMPTGKYVRIGLDHPTCWKEDAPYEHLVALCVLSDAQAIIDGLLDQIHVAHEKVGRYADQRDQHAQRIGELEGLLLQSYRQVNSECQDWAKEYERRKEVQAERDSLINMLREFAVVISKREMPTEQELNGWFDRIDAALSAGKEGK